MKVDKNNKTKRTYEINKTNFIRWYYDNDISKKCIRFRNTYNK